MTLSIVEMAALAAVAVVALMLGWSGRKLATRGKEAKQRRTVFEAKGAIPQLESTLRHRDQQIAHLQEQIGELKDRGSEMADNHRRQDTEVIKRDREIRTLQSELQVLKEGDSEGMLLLEEMADPLGNEEDLVERVKDAEIRYEKLKLGLIKRDDRITELEAELERPQSGAPALKSQIGELEESSANLTQDLAAKNEEIDRLKVKLQEEAERREVLETLAKKRSETTLQLKESTAELRAEVPQLREAIAERDQLIEQRDASVRAVGQQLRDVKAEKAQRENTIRDLEKTQAEHAAVLAARDAQMQQQRDRHADDLGQLELDLERLRADHQSELISREAEADRVRAQHVNELQARQAQADEAAAQHTKALAAQKAKATETLTAVRAEHATALANLEEKLARLHQELAQRDRELDETQKVLIAKKSALAAAEKRLQKSAQELDRTCHALDDKSQAVEALYTTVHDRDSKIDAFIRNLNELGGYIEQTSGSFEAATLAQREQLDIITTETQACLNGERMNPDDQPSNGPDPEVLAEQMAGERMESLRKSHEAAMEPLKLRVAELESALRRAEEHATELARTTELARATEVGQRDDVAAVTETLRTQIRNLEDELEHVRKQREEQRSAAETTARKHAAEKAAAERAAATAEHAAAEKAADSNVHQSEGDALKNRIRDLEGQVQVAADERLAYDRTVKELRAELDATKGSGPAPEEAPKTLASLQSALKDRDFKIGSLEADIARLEARLLGHGTEGER